MAHRQTIPASIIHMVQFTAVTPCCSCLVIIFLFCLLRFLQSQGRSKAPNMSSLTRTPRLSTRGGRALVALIGWSNAALRSCKPYSQCRYSSTGLLTVRELEALLTWIRSKPLSAQRQYRWQVV
jgi:hypothetical protein